MEPIEAENEKQTEILVKQYEHAWKDIWESDQNYIRITLLYITLIGVYIGTFKIWSPGKLSNLISIIILLLSICILGVIYRTRKIINQQFQVIREIERKASMIAIPQISGLGKIRTSTYLGIIVILLTILAIFLTYQV